MATTSKNDLNATLTTCANGLTANFPATQSWVFGGKTYKRGDIVGMLQATITASQTTQTSHTTWLASVEAEKAQLAALHPVLASLKKALELEWGSTSTKLAEFGFEPARPPTKTAASKAASAAKARATRAAKKAAVASVETPPKPAAETTPATAPVPPKTA
jgi:septal ring factor EnvC (AmiA/AmiB activator)